MASNPFDQFDNDNPFDQFDSAPAPRGATGSWGGGVSGAWSDPRLSAMSGVEKFRTGAKITGRRYALGAKQIMGKATPQDADAMRESNAGLLEDPIVQAGELTANIAAPAALAFAPYAGSILGSAAIGGAVGGIQPVGTGESRAHNAFTGAAISGGVTAGMKGIGRIMHPVKNALSAEANKAVKTLDDAGVRLPVGARTGSKAVQTTERMLSDNPYTGPAMGDAMEKTKRSMTRAFLKLAGENADAATPEVLGRAKDRIGGGIGTINRRYALDINAKTVAALDDQADEAMRVLDDARIAKQVERIKKLTVNGKLDARSAQKIRKELQDLAAQPNVSPYAREVREALDDALERVATPQDRAALKTLRSQYRNLMAIADAVDTTANGQISPTALAQRLKSSKFTKNSFRYGKGDAELSELARAASTVVDRFPNSGTAARAGAQLIAPTLVGGASYINEGDPEKALKLAAATYVAPRVAASVLTNPRTANYLAQGFGSTPMPTQNVLAQYLGRLAGPSAATLFLPTQ
jgi:hypothetical protein